MATFFALVEQDEDSAFGITFPDVPGCFSAADDADEILSNAVQALELHLEHEKAPRAQSIVALKADPEVQSALQEGAYLLAVPFIRTEQRSKRINVSLDAGVLRAIDDAAKIRGLTRSAFITEAALKEVKAG